MTKEEFREAIQEIADNIADPNSTYHAWLAEGRQLADDCKQFDPGISQRIQQVVAAVESLATYARDRMEETERA